MWPCVCFLPYFLHFLNDFYVQNICCLMLQLTINLLPVNHAPFFQLSYYVVRDVLESADIGDVIATGKTMALL